MSSSVCNCDIGMCEQPHFTQFVFWFRSHYIQPSKCSKLQYDSDSGMFSRNRLRWDYGPIFNALFNEICKEEFYETVT